MDVDFSSTRSIEKIFTDVVQQSQTRQNKIRELDKKVFDFLGVDLTEKQRQDLQNSLGDLGEAFCYLKDQAEYPELVIATTGTTSSGKSTLANFLIGEAILPSAVQEMSAGLVRVKHGEKRSLTIPETKGATWETGSWDGLTADEMSQLLEETMMAFRKEEESNKEIEPVLFEIEWPIRFAERKKEFNLPEGTQVTILDLPGLKAVNDKRNGPIIQANIDKAFCLVAYNAEETDKQKQETLLKEVVNQVLALSYGKKDKEDNNTEDYAGSNVPSLARMLFLLNRVDVFRRDKDPVASLKKFRTDITAQMCEKLEEARPESGEIIKGLERAQSSSKPALLAVKADRLWERPED
ncbi:MAG: dynamin family protein, partial [Acetobacter sp.]|nr:dynamin family protein [Acetobacter sp.]